MTEQTVKRCVDGGHPIPLWAPAAHPAAKPCGHGILVETRVDANDTMCLLLRRMEDAGENSAHVERVAVEVTVDVETGTVQARNDAATEFISSTPWLSKELAKKPEWLHARLERAIAQRDSEAVAAAALQQVESGSMTSYDTLFPADWDLLANAEGVNYWAVDQYCCNPHCGCTEVVIHFEALRHPDTQYGGNVRFNVKGRRPSPEASSPLALQLFKQVWSGQRDQLRARYKKVRAAVAQQARPATAEPSKAAPRNAPCPCGSGKKYKRCCAMVACP